jgi:Tol biopolymer transport system component
MRRESSNPDTAKNLQLWVMHADGSQARRLTDQTDALYGALNWSPDGHYLLFHQYVLKKQRDPQIWLLNVQTGELQLIASPGYWPAWLP